MSAAGAPLFLTLEQVLRFHDQQIEQFGGAAELVDQGLLESALSQVGATQADMYAETLQLVTSVTDKKHFASFLRAHRA